MARFMALAHQMAQIYEYVKVADLQNLCSEDVEAQQSKAMDLKAMEDVYWRMRNSIPWVMMLAMAVVCFSFLGMLGIPTCLEKEVGYAGAEEAMNSYGFMVFVISDAVAFFSSLGVVAILILKKSMIDAQMVLICSRVAIVAIGCAGAAFMAALLDIPEISMVVCVIL